MRWCLPALMLLLTATQLSAAQKVAFPYEATVEAAETYVRTGPGTKYYPTSKLKLGQRVMVQRHDPGGWHMIFPPEGSFSWVPGRSVKKTAGDHGTVVGHDVQVWVGSFESDIREIWQCTLQEHDDVRILGEKKLPPEQGKQGPDETWYRIAPPRGEWRWIVGQALSPPPRDGDLGGGDDPFDTSSVSRQRTPARRAPAVPAIDDRLERSGSKGAGRSYLDNDETATRSLNAGEGEIVDRPVVRKQGRPSNGAAPAVTAKRRDALLDELERLDARFRSIVERDPLEWDFSQLERDYRHLRSDAENASLEQTIDLRLARIDDYRKTRAEKEELARLADETLRRDAELAEIQRKHEVRLTALRQPRFDGAGIVERSALSQRGAPKYALLAPSGKVVAYLAAAPGVDLEAWLGRSAGVTGTRVANASLKADLITVVRLTAVRLTP